jgi:hypothetical protein
MSDYFEVWRYVNGKKVRVIRRREYNTITKDEIDKC